MHCKKMSLQHRYSDAVAAGVSRRGLEGFDVRFARQDVADGLAESASSFSVDYADAGEALHEGSIDKLWDHRFDHVDSRTADVKIAGSIGNAGHPRRRWLLS